MKRKTRWLAGVAGLLLLAGVAQAQQRIGTTSSGGGFSGSSSGGFSGSSGGGFSGSSGGFIGSSGGFSGSSSGGFSGSSGTFGGGSSSGFAGGTATGGRGGSGTSTYGQTSIIGRFYGNPMAMGYSSTTSGSASGSSPATQNIRAYPQTLTFGQPIVDQATLTRTTQLGTTSGNLGNLGGNRGTNLGTGSLSQQQAFGASSVGIRRSPSYLTSMAFDRPAMVQQSRVTVPQPSPVVTPLNTAQLRTTITNAPRLPSRDNITVETAGAGTVVLRGNVTSERERRLAETMMYTSPGVGEVRNELQRKRR